MTDVLAVANQKGGVAKTTTVHSLGVASAELGRRTLVVDLDPQACLTFSLGFDPDALERSLHDVFVRRDLVAEVSLPSLGVGYERIAQDLIAADAFQKWVQPLGISYTSQTKGETHE